MRIFLFIICLISTIFLVGSVYASSLINLEKSVIKDGDTMYTANYYNTLISEVKNTCGSTYTALAQTYTDDMIASLESQYALIPTYKVLQNTKMLHDRLQSRHDRLIGVQEKYYCVLKLMMYSTQDRLRNYNLDIFESSGIINDFGSFDLNTFNGSQIKLEGLEYEINQLKQYPAKLGIDLDIDLIGAENTNTGAEWEKLRDVSGELMRLTVYEILYEMREMGLVDNASIQQLVGKITMEYKKSCDSFHGNYRVKKTTNGNTGKVTLETVEMPFQVNVCPNYFLLGNLHEYFKKIITHELAHHVYHFHDNNTSSFESICRAGSSQRKSSCSTSNDFVTPYAASLDAEDYAESFMHVFLNIGEFDTPILMQKKAYFDKLLGR